MKDREGDAKWLFWRVIRCESFYSYIWLFGASGNCRKVSSKAGTLSQLTRVSWVKSVTQLEFLNICIVTNDSELGSTQAKLDLSQNYWLEWLNFPALVSSVCKTLMYNYIISRIGQIQESQPAAQVWMEQEGWSYLTYPTYDNDTSMFYRHKIDRETWVIWWRQKPCCVSPHTRWIWRCGSRLLLAAS